MAFTPCLILLKTALGLVRIGLMRRSMVVAVRMVTMMVMMPIPMIMGMAVIVVQPLARARIVGEHQRLDGYRDRWPGWWSITRSS